MAASVKYVFGKTLGIGSGPTILRVENGMAEEIGYVGERNNNKALAEAIAKLACTAFNSGLTVEAVCALIEANEKPEPANG